MSQLVFLTFFLGLVAGPQTVTLDGTPDIHTVAILVDEQKVTTLQRPFTGTIDLGSKLAPRLLLAVGYDAAVKLGSYLESQLNGRRPSQTLLNQVVFQIRPQVTSPTHRAVRRSRSW